MNRSIITALVAVLSITGIPQASDEMGGAATTFLNSLTPEQKTAALFEFNDDERENWHYIPKQRKGLAVKNMNAAQRKATRALLHSGLSDAGVSTVDAVSMLEGILREQDKAAGKKNWSRRDTEMYQVSIFGEPGKHPWAWRYEGHHLSVNFTSASGTKVGSTPYFIGTNPAIVKSGKHQGLEVLEKEINIAKAAFASLSDDQKKTALMDSTPQEIVTKADRHVTLPEPTGVKLSSLNAVQRKRVLAVIEQYASHFVKELAALRMKEISAAGTDGITFAWAGDPQTKTAHYYRIQGQSFIIEYVNVQNGARHAHAVWRDTRSDFGHDYLKAHIDHHHD